MTGYLVKEKQLQPVILNLFQDLMVGEAEIAGFAGVYKFTQNF